MSSGLPHSNTTTEILKRISRVEMWKTLMIVELKNSLNLSQGLGYHQPLRI